MSLMSASIKEIVEKIKHFYTNLPDELFMVIMLILVGLSSFGLGRLSLLEQNKQHVSLTYNTDIATMPRQDISGAVVASRRGTRYHYPWCSGAKRISTSNKRWFNSVEDAKKAGYTPASNCNGLE